MLTYESHFVFFGYGSDELQCISIHGVIEILLVQYTHTHTTIYTVC